MKRRTPNEIRRWLAQQPTTVELAEVFPSEWQQVEREIGALLAKGNGGYSVATYLASLSKGNPDGFGAHGRGALKREIHHHLAVALLRQMRLSTTTGVTEGTVRFNLLNGWVAQHLLFANGLERKPVSLPHGSRRR